MLWSGDCEVVPGIRTLHARNIRDRQARAQKRVLTVGFLTAPPARVAEDVDVRRPEVEAFENVGMPSSFGLGMLDAPFDADRGRHLVNARYIKRRGQTDGLRKFGCSVGGDAVQGLAPPIVCWHAEAHNRARLVH